MSMMSAMMQQQEAGVPQVHLKIIELKNNDHFNDDDDANDYDDDNQLHVCNVPQEHLNTTK